MKIQDQDERAQEGEASSLGQTILLLSLYCICRLTFFYYSKLNNQSQVHE